MTRISTLSAAVAMVVATFIASPHACACECGNWMAVERREAILRGEVATFVLVEVDVLAEPDCVGEPLPTCHHQIMVRDLRSESSVVIHTTLTTVEEGCGASALQPGRHVVAAELAYPPSGLLGGLRMGMCPIELTPTEYASAAGHRAGCASCTIAAAEQRLSLTSFAVSCVPMALFFLRRRKSKEQCREARTPDRR